MEIILAGISLSFIGILVKTLSGQVSPAFVLWFRCISHIVILTPLIFKNGFKLNRPKASLLRALSGFMGMSLYFLALQHVPLTLASSVFFAAPIFTLLLNYIFDQKVILPSEKISILFLLSGITFLSIPNSILKEQISPLYLLVCLMSAIGIGGSYFFLGRLSRDKESPLSISYSFSYLMFIFSTPGALVQGPSNVSLAMCLSLSGIAILAVLYQYLITLGYANHSTEKAATLQAIVTPLISVSADRLIFHHNLSINASIGVSLIIFSALSKHIPMRRLVTASVLLFAALGSSSAHAIAVKDLQGTWSLVSYHKVENGIESEWCSNPFGTISYFARHRMSVQINCMSEVKANEIDSDLKNMVFYSGSYSLQQPNAVVHHVENSSEISRIGHDHIRYAELKGDQVTLTGLGTKGEFKIVWKKQN